MTSATNDEAIAQSIARLATATGTVSIAANACLAAFAIAGEPWGSINDAGGAAVAVLAGSLAWRLRSYGGTATTAAALAGATVAVAGAGLVISGTTGWLLAGFVSGVGFGLIGPSVVAASSGLASDGVVPQRLGRFGRATGVLMSVGLAAAVPVALRIDDAATAPAWAWLTMAGWAGTAILYPAWTIWLGRSTARRVDAITAAA